MKGTYRFYQNGVLLGEHLNLITDEGKRLILRVLAGWSPSIGEAMAVGTGTTPVTAADTMLTFESARANVELRVPDYDTNRVIFKATLPQELITNIYEVGIFSQSNNSLAGSSSSNLVTSFDFLNEAWVAGSTTTLTAGTGQRIGQDSLKVAVTANGSGYASLPVDLDFSGYSVNDTFSIAYKLNDANTSSISLSFITGNGGESKYTISTTSDAAGYYVKNFPKSAMTVTGFPDWSDIVSIKVGVNAKAGGATSVDLDGIRAEDADTINPDYALVSRSVLASPLSKSNVAPMDIEYAIEFDVV